MSELTFNLKTTVRPVVLEDAEGKQVKMALHEMSAAVRDRYLDSLTGRMRLDPSGQIAGVKKFEGLQSGLLVCCLKKEDGTLVTEKEVQEWPASVVTQLFQAAQELNKLVRTPGDSEKNG